LDSRPTFYRMRFLILFSQRPLAEHKTKHFTLEILFSILVVLAVLVATVLIGALFVKEEFNIRRDIIVNKSASEVFDYVRILRNQEHYSKWVMADPHMKKTFRGQDGTVGFVYGWNGNKKAGEGEQEITGLTEGMKVDIEVRFVRPFKSTARIPIVIEPVAETQTRVIWGMEGRTKYPMNLTNLFVGNVLGKDLQVSLQTLKDILEGRHQDVSAPAVS
jgi:hypothetical protein